MVGHVMQHPMRTLLQVWSVLALLGHSAGWAMGPAAPFVEPGVDQASAQLDVAVGADTVAPSVGLSGVRLGRQAGAVIDGQWVRKGRTVRGARLVEVQRTRVTLQHPDGHQEIIEMYPPAGGVAGVKAAASTEAIKP